MRKVVIGMTLAVVFSMTYVSLANAMEYGINAGGAYYNWKENTNCGTVEETGPIWAIGGYVSGAPDARAPALRLRSDVEVFRGRVYYDTFYITTTLVPPTTTCNGVRTYTDYWGYKLEGSVGWRVSFQYAHVEPFLGLAYRTWERDIESGAATGYPELYRTFYGRIGVRTSFMLSPGITFKSTLSLDPMRAAREKVDYPTFVGPDLTVNLRNGRRLGWTIEGGVIWRTLEATAYWQATRFGESNVVSGLLQPKSFQDIIGLEVGYLF